MSWELHIRKKVKKAILSFPKADQRRIAFVLRDMPSNPYVGDIEKLGGEENTWRRRIGAYRIFYELRVSQRIIYVYHLERRGSKTY